MPPIDTAVAELKLVPVMVTVALLEAHTLDGVKDEIVGDVVTANMA